MSAQEWYAYLASQFLNIDVLQWAILVLGVSEVLLAKVNNILLYPTGIAATALAIYSLFAAQLYAECLLHLYYIVMSIYGWWHWTKKKNEPAVIVRFTTRREWLFSLVIIFGESASGGARWSGGSRKHSQRRYHLQHHDSSMGLGLLTFYAPLIFIISQTNHADWRYEDFATRD